MTAPLLDVRALRKRFGGVVATDGVDLQVHGGEIHALIGPNGAGKTSLVAQLAGQLASDSGSVHFDGHEITRLVAHQRARRGLVRSFQITRLLKSLPVLGNLAFAVQATQGRVFAAWRPVREEHALFERARELLARLGLQGKADARIDQLSHGEQRALEVGMTQLIHSLRQDCAVLLIEHDVDAVFRLADRVSVLVSGRIIASSTPDAVRQDAGAIAAYLGDAEDNG